MGIFGNRQKVEPPVRPILRIDGQRQTKPEDSGERMGRLFRLCHDILATDPYVLDWNPPIGPTWELPRLARIVQDRAFSTDASLISQVAVRRYLSYLQVNYEDLRMLYLAAGIELDEEQERFRISETARPDGFSDRARDEAIAFALHLTELVNASDGNKISETPQPQLERMWGRSFPEPPEAAIWIAWIATVAIRCYKVGHMNNVFELFDVASALSEPGWYADPIYSAGERYWDGRDWTNRCRIPDGRRYEEVDRELP